MKTDRIGPRERLRILSAARGCIGTPYMHQGRLPGVALDCAGLVICVGWQIGIWPESFDVTGYAATPDGKSLIGHCDSCMTRIDRAEMKPGDVLVIRWATDPQHLGIVGDYLHGGLSLIHAFSNPDGRGSVMEHHLGDAHLRRCIAAYRLPGVPDDDRLDAPTVDDGAPA